MSIISGGLSLIRFKIKHKINNEELVKGLNSFKANEVITAEKNESFGWSNASNFLDSQFKLQKIDFGNYFLFSLRHTFKKVPASLLRAYCIQEEYKILAESRKEKLSRFEKSEIRARVRDKLFKAQPIEYKVFDCMLEIKTGVLYFTGTGKKIIGELIKLFELSFDVTPQLLDATGIAGQMLNATDYKALNQKLPAKYTPAKMGVDKEISLDLFLGGDFLTWLWYQIEEQRAEFGTGKNKAGLLIEDFLLIRHPQNSSMDSLENTIKNGLPTLCSEASAALYSGKKLFQAKIVLGVNERVWNFRINSINFSLSSIKLPSLDGDSDTDALEERLSRISELFLVIDTVFLTFLEDYLSDDWENAENNIRKWVKKKRDDTL